MIGILKSGRDSLAHALTQIRGRSFKGCDLPEDDLGVSDAVLRDRAGGDKVAETLGLLKILKSSKS
jgi:hypothetical protein